MAICGLEQCFSTVGTRPSPAISNLQGHLLFINGHLNVANDFASKKSQNFDSLSKRKQKSRPFYLIYVLKLLNGAKTDGSGWNIWNQSLYLEHICQIKMLF